MLARCLEPVNQKEIVVKGPVSSAKGRASSRPVSPGANTGAPEPGMARPIAPPYGPANS